jgi:hypothetical protein
MIVCYQKEKKNARDMAMEAIAIIDVGFRVTLMAPNPQR